MLRTLPSTGFRAYYFFWSSFFVSSFFWSSFLSPPPPQAPNRITMRDRSKASVNRFNCATLLKTALLSDRYAEQIRTTAARLWRRIFNAGLIGHVFEFVASVT